MKKFIVTVLLLCVFPMTATAAITLLGAGTRATATTTPMQVRDTSKKFKGDRYVTVCNDRSSLVEIFVNGAGVTPQTGTPVEPGLCWYSGERLARSVGVWVVTLSGTATIRVTEAQ